MSDACVLAHNVTDECECVRERLLVCVHMYADGVWAYVRVRYVTIDCERVCVHMCADDVCARARVPVCIT